MAKCIVCGNKSIGSTERIITDNLAAAWKLSKYERFQFDIRESRFCLTCQSSTRIRALAGAIMNRIPFSGADTFVQWVDKAEKHKLIIAEINSCGCLHTFLKKIPNLKYSEFTTENSFIKFTRKLRGAPHENIQSLTYKNNTFDLVIHTEVFEHVPDPSKAIIECKRVLKREGHCIFTVPIIMKRKTVQCTILKNDRVVYLRPPSYHGTTNKQDYLVWWEFGKDFMIKENLSTVQSNERANNYVFETGKH